MKKMLTLAGDFGQAQGAYQYLANVVQVKFPVRAARSYLMRHMANRIQYCLVEVRRGEELGCIREVQVIPSDGVAPVRVSVERLLPDGSPANFFAPPSLVRKQLMIQTEDGGTVPTIRTEDIIVLHVPVRSYLRFLPGLYQGAAPTMRRDVVRQNDLSKRQMAIEDKSTTQRVEAQNINSFQQFLLLFQHMMTTVTDKIENLPDLVDPLRTEARMLPWLASWVNFPLDHALPIHQQRELVRRSIRLHRMRGTAEGIAEMVRVLTAAPVQIIERSPPRSCTLGQMALAGASRIEDRFSRREPAGSYMLQPKRKKLSYFVLQLEHERQFQRRFGERALSVLRRISQIVTQESPAHIVFTIQFAPKT